jgi:hypothetical protein
MHTMTKRAASTAFIALTLGCARTGESPMEPIAASASRAAERCANVHVEETAALGAVEIAPGVFTLGALPTPVTIAGVSGMLGSAVTGLAASGAKGQGAQHITLVHTFVSPEGTFTTSDRAVCGVAGTDANVCRVNDVLRVVSGTGVFADAGGAFRNHGVIDLNAYSLTISLRGRICGDGV